MADGPTMPPPPPDPSGSPPAHDPVKDILDATATKGLLTGGVIWPPGSFSSHGDLNVTYTGRFLDPVRAHALAQAVNHAGVNGVEGDDVPGEVLAIASRFEAWLVGEQESEG
jgi:hypothetical protein